MTERKKEVHSTARKNLVLGGLGAWLQKVGCGHEDAQGHGREVVEPRDTGVGVEA